MRDSGRTFYDALACFPEASPSQIRQAYRKAALRWHPDKAHPADKALAQQRFQEVAKAYEVLSNREQRQTYDLYLRCRSQGYIEVANPEDPHGGYVEVPFRDWDEFSTFFSTGSLQPGTWMGENSSRYDEDTPDGADAPITVWEWLVAGGLALGLWCIAVWRHQHHVWLKEMPGWIYRNHVEYAAPMGLLMAPLFFGTVSFPEAMDWLNAAIDSIDE
eukprot:TRINITY_DN42928_c0_g1_i1.p1 TRINITY_DN42928_c0_g1~~TRINITY_DN42928_c0_g1_i1.p1  ORF type:complete len:217 (-),score=30.39 TRINITY_DN42928_c0_g1_i1:18-668(-)